MKHNLQTFPEKRQAQGLEYSVGDIEEWLKGFTEELQQLDKLAYHEVPDYCLADENGTYIRIDKVLGIKP